MSNVYVVQEAHGKNLLPARDFGEVRVLLPPGQIMFSVAPTIKRLKLLLRHFTDDDYLLCMGDPAAIGLACAVASSFNGGNFKLLKWDKQERTYFSINCNLHGRTDE